MRARRRTLETVTPDRIITIRVSRGGADEVRCIAERDAETHSTMFRQLIRLGLRERRDLAGAER